MQKEQIGELNNIGVDIVHLARLALSGRRQDIELYIRKLVGPSRPLSEHTKNQLIECRY